MSKITVDNPVEVKKRKTPNLSEKLSVLIRTAICQNDGCKNPLSGGVEYDHKIPLELGGDNVIDNLQALCVPCHLKKTKVDVAAIRRAGRRQKKILTGQSLKATGRKLKSRGFNKTLRKTFSGEVIKRKPEN